MKSLERCIVERELEIVNQRLNKELDAANKIALRVKQMVLEELLELFEDAYIREGKS